MNFEEDTAPELIDQKYDALLSEYTKLKEELQTTASEKELDAEFATLSDSLKAIGNAETIPHNAEEANAIKAQIEEETKRASEITAKFAQSHEELREKIQKKKTELSSSSDSGKTGTINAEKQQIENEIAKISSEISSGKQQLTALQDEQSKIKQKTAAVEAEQKKNNEKAESIKDEISALKKEASDLEATLKTLKGEVETLGKSESKLANPTVLEEELAKIVQKIKQQKDDNAKTAKQAAADKEAAKAAQKAAKELGEKESALQKELKETKDKEEKIRKLIDAHANEIKKIQQDKRDKKTKQMDLMAEVNKIENENKYLETAIGWEIKKLEDFRLMKKKYINKKEIDALQEEKNGYDMFNKRSEVVNGNIEFAKVSKKLEEIKKSVTKQKKENARTIATRETQINELKEKRDDLKKKRDENEKVLNDAKSKLEEYKKEYPDHEHNKARVQEEEKKRKAEETKKKQAEQTEKKKEAGNKKIKNESTEEEDLEKYLPRVSNNDEKYLSNLLSGPNAKIFGVVGVIAAAVLASTVF